VQLARRLPTPLPDQSRPDVRRITEDFDRYGVDYLVTGGVATQAYGAERPTGDFDCLALPYVAGTPPVWPWRRTA
jgi:hypothetical protein